MLHWGLKQLYRLRHKNTVNILIYHQVLHEPDHMRPSEPTYDVFDWQMKLLRDYFTPMSLDDAVAGLKHGKLPDNAICVTFDDGYLNNLTLAQPILETYQIPATFYVATGFSRGTNMWNDRVIHLFADPTLSHLQLDDDYIVLGDDEDRRNQSYARLKALKYLPVTERVAKVDAWYKQNNAREQPALMMTPEQVRELSERPGVTIGAHTVNHPILKVHTPEIQQQEILESKQTLETWIDKPVRHFAYPNGGWQTDVDETTVEIAQRSGFDSAVITNWGKASLCTDRFKLPRFTPWDQRPSKFFVRLLVT